MRRTVYLDHSASTPTDPRVVEAMLPYFTEVYGNPSSSHSFGRKAELAIENARETIAGILHCQPSEIIFTSGGSESDNLAIRGAAWYARTQGRDCHLISQPTEHSAVGRTIEQMATVMDFEASYVPVDRYGAVGMSAFEAACRPNTVLASIMYANNEVGTLSPIPELASAARNRGILFHTDAVQAGGQMTLDVQRLGVDMLSLSAHKFYGPKGIGLLYVRDGIKLISSQSGGSHEDGRRAGTHNTPFIVGMAKALELAYSDFDAHVTHYRTMRDRLIEGVLSQVNGAHLTGHPQDRLPGHASFIIDGIESNMLLVHLDMKGVAASSASACKTGNPEPSGVLMAMGYTPEEALSSLRLTVGRQTTAEDVDYAVSVLAEAVEKLQRMTV
jgi:cysteine desulfurase